MAITRKRPAVSVALASHNGERFIREQLESIQRQTVLPTEIVISDDNSRDRTRDIVSEVLSPAWCQEFGVSLLVLHNAEPLGPGPNFEQAIMACSGDFIVLADQDDRWHETKVEVLLDAFDGRPETLLVHSDADLVDALGKPLGITLTAGIGFREWERQQLASGQSLPAFLKRNLATGATMMFRGDLAKVAFPLPAGELHDRWLALAASLMDGVVFLPISLIDYRQHDDNQVGGLGLAAQDKIVSLLGSWQAKMADLATENTWIDSLIRRLGATVSSENHRIAEERKAHNRWRMSLPSSRILRVWPVIYGFVTGRYRRHGRQPHDVLRDLLMPPRDVFLGFLRSVSRSPRK
jgi:glycosyltransferase involved in cell wall biosynthesis